MNVSQMKTSTGVGMEQMMLQIKDNFMLSSRSTLILIALRHET